MTTRYFPTIPSIIFGADLSLNVNVELADLQRSNAGDKAGAGASASIEQTTCSVLESAEQAAAEVVVNIEIDGPHHKQARKHRFCQLRDNYLTRDHGVLVLRLDVMAQRGWSEAQKVAHIRERLRQQPVHLPGLDLQPRK